MRFQLYSICKRIIDITGAGVGLALLSPAIVVIAVLVRGDGGPVFYKATRVGRYGIPFSMYKFRTMIPNADKVGGSSTADDDPRLTAVGRSLRRHKLDELPQLINVVKGDMSLVGPRPQIQWAVDLYTPEERELLSVRPGMTDYASLQFSNEGEILKGSVDPDADYLEKIHPKKMQLGLDYVKNRSLSTDLSILAQTFITVFR